MDKKYCSFFHKEKDKEVNVTFPDFPGCVAAGNDFKEALKSAQEALEFHIEGMVLEDYDIPEPKDINELIDIAKECEENPQIVWLSVEIPERKVQRVNITMPEYALKKIDSYLSTHKNLKNRSNFLVEAASDYIHKHA